MPVYERGPKGDRGEQGLSAKEWKTYVIGAVLAALMATTGTVYALTTNRISKVENAVAAHVEMDTAVKVQLAVIQETIAQIKEASDKNDVKRDELAAKVDALSQSILRDSTRWNRIMDEFERQQREQK